MLKKNFQVTENNKKTDLYMTCKLQKICKSLQRQVLNNPRLILTYKMIQFPLQVKKTSCVIPTQTTRTTEIGHCLMKKKARKISIKKKLSKRKLKTLKKILTRAILVYQNHATFRMPKMMGLIHWRKPSSKSSQIICFKTRLLKRPKDFVKECSS